MNDEALLAESPDFLSIGSFFKATPAEEAGKRVLYLEASNEGLDQQGEVVAAKALADSADYFRRYGNIDIDHYTKIGAKVGIPDYTLYEVGRPVDVKQSGKTTFVKAEVFCGMGPAAERANQLWASITQITPPQRWYPSVGGSVLAKHIDIDAKTGDRKVIISKVRWNNIGLSKTPVNQHVGDVATVPMGAFAKSWTPAGFDISKALTAGYGTDSAGLTGGGAMRKQSLYGSPMQYFEYRDKMSDAVRKKMCKASATDMHAYGVHSFGLNEDLSSEYLERFMRDLKTALSQRKTA